MGIPDILDDLKSGKMVIVVDDESRENEGDLVCSAELIDEKTVNFMISHARGLLCLALEESWCDHLGLYPMARDNKSKFGTNFTVSIGAARGITTGVSAVDRARTILAAVNPNARKSDIVTPGHVFPLRAKVGGVLVRDGHTEAGVDLNRLAGLFPAAVICEILNEDGTMARLPELEKYAITHQLNIVSIASLIEYRAEREKLIDYLGSRTFDIDFGSIRVSNLKLFMFEDLYSRSKHYALVKMKGDVFDPTCPTSICVFEQPLDVLEFLSKGEYLELMEEFSVAPQAVFLFICTSFAAKDYAVAKQILLFLNVGEKKILTGSPKLLTMF